VSLSAEIKRKVFHHLALIYLIAFAVLPRLVCLSILGVAIVIVSGVELIRLRRPEVNAYLLSKFNGIHRQSEILSASGIFWTLLGSWITMLAFTNKRIVLPALGFLVFGDTAAALVGKKWGRRPIPWNSAKTVEGMVGFFVVSVVWALFFVRWPVAILGSGVAAWLESRTYKWNDNFWLPFLSGWVLSVLNLFVGR
jgi:dolichol kinase